MTQRLVTSSTAAFADATPLDRLCDAIAANDMAAFDSLLPQVDDIDARHHRAIFACVTHDRFAMVKKIFICGAARTLALAELEKKSAAAYKKYMSKPSGEDQVELAAYQAAKSLHDRLAAWKASFENDTLSTLPLQKMQELEDKIDALRLELAEALSPQRTIIKKNTPAPGAKGGPSC